MRKLMVLCLDGLRLDAIISNEALENIHRLMEFGCYGYLEPAQYYDNALAVMRPIWVQIAQQGRCVTVFGKIPEDMDESGITAYRLDLTSTHGLNYLMTVCDLYSNAVEIIKVENWDCFVVFGGHLDIYRWMEEKDKPTEMTLKEFYIRLDEQVGSVLSVLTENTAVLILSVESDTSDRRGFFILAYTNNPLSGLIDGVQPSDLIPTLLEVGGYNISDIYQGKSLISSDTVSLPKENNLTEDEEALLRERLSGLGYIS